MREYQVLSIFTRNLANMTRTQKIENNNLKLYIELKFNINKYNSH